MRHVAVKKIGNFAYSRVGQVALRSINEGLLKWESDPLIKAYREFTYTLVLR